MARYEGAASGCLVLALLISLLLLTTSMTEAVNLYLHAAKSRGNHVTVKRSNSRSGTAVHLGGGDTLHVNFCLRQRTKVQVQSVLYSNDGQQENVAVVVDDTFVGTFPTHGRSDWGNLWNVFFASPPFHRAVDLPAGWHTLRLAVLVPADGVEIDAVKVWFSDSRLTQAMVECQLFCRTSLPSVPQNDARIARQAQVQQWSYPTKCAEEDNVKVPIYLRGISEYTVTATMPTYLTFSNRREANTTGCPYLPPLLWTFKDIAVPSSRPLSLGSENASLKILQKSITLPSGDFSQVLRVEFVLRGKSDGFVDADMGSDLTVTVRQSSAWVTVRIAYVSRSGSLQTIRDVSFPPGQTKGHVTFPDFTWREHITNTILLEVRSRKPVLFHEIQLDRRPMKGEKVRQVYHSGRVTVDAIEVDFWWRRPETMELINGETGQRWNNVDFFRISLAVPWNGGFAQVFVMYQDGNVRLVPLPPSGLDWIPFGSSVIIGQSDPSHLRPAAPVSAVTFYPASLTMHVRYRDNSSANITLTSTLSETMVTVSDLHFSGKNAGILPFATLRSMYIEDGNSDCDSLMVDGNKYHHIMDKWSVESGKSIFFFRRCESVHLTLSPDIRIDVTKTSWNGVTSNSWWWQWYTSQGITGNRSPVGQSQ